MADSTASALLNPSRFVDQAPAPSRFVRRLPIITAYIALLGLLLFTAFLGQVGVGAARLLFVVGCFGVAVRAYRTGGLPLHLESSLVLFVFAPLLRRVVDVHLGYDASGTMLVGPLLALTAAFPELRRLLAKRRGEMIVFLPYLLITACVTYGWIISAFQNNIVPATIAAAKYMVPMLYCVCLLLRPDESTRVLRAAVRAFLIIGPIIGLYGIAQEVSPQTWDTYWIVASKFEAAGQPEPMQVRVFSTMNSPASFATYAVCGLLLFSFARSFIPTVLVPFVALLPLSMSLLLSGIRTAWISAAVSLLFCLLFRSTRRRASLVIICLVVGITFTLLLTSFGTGIADRLSSLSGSLSQDGSASERLHDYVYVFTEGQRYLFGMGLSADADARMAALDGQLLLSVVQMGLVFGTLHTLLIMWAGVQGLLTLRHNQEVLRVVAGALILGEMSVFLLIGFSVGEIGFLFWMLVGVLTGPPEQRSRVSARRSLGDDRRQPRTQRSVSRWATTPNANRMRETNQALTRSPSSLSFAGRAACSTMLLAASPLASQLQAAVVWAMCPFTRNGVSTEHDVVIAVTRTPVEV